MISFSFSLQLFPSLSFSKFQKFSKSHVHVLGGINRTFKKFSRALEENFQIPGIPRNPGAMPTLINFQVVSKIVDSNNSHGLHLRVVTYPSLSSLLPEWVEVTPTAKSMWTVLYHQGSLLKEVSSCIAVERMLCV